MDFAARVIAGTGRGRRLGFPTLNLDPRDVPEDLAHGIYACLVNTESQKREARSLCKGALHYGPRPAFDDDAVSCEIYLLDTLLETTPPSLEVHIVARLREIRGFPSLEALKEQITQDVREVRAILGAP